MKYVATPEKIYSLINQSPSGETVSWEDSEGRVFHETIRQEYNNCLLCAGQVENAGVDTLFLHLERHAEPGKIGGQLILLRPDEMAVIGWLASGALYSHCMAEMDKEK